MNSDKIRSDRVKDFMHSRAFYGIIALLLPAVIMIIAYAGMGVFPFGDRAAMIIDSYHQYVPFFSELHNKIWSGDSLLYSWHGSLGYNFIAVQAYYLASPLNFIVALFPSSMMIEAFESLIIIKISISCWSAWYYLSSRTGRYKADAVIFAGFYALGGFTVAYSWNVMWLDCVALFPLVVLGIERFINKKDWRLYTIILGLSIFCNYYIAIMVCIFAVLYYFVVWFEKKRGGIKKFFGTGIRFAGCSLLAGGLACIYLIPVFFVMINSSQGSAPEGIEFYRGFFSILRQQFVLSEPTQLTGAPNIYCGVFTGIMVLLYILARNIKMREKAGRLVLTGFVLLSMNVSVLDYVWHGFHFPNDLPARFSFIYIFLMVAMAFDGWASLKKTGAGTYLVIFAAAAALFGMCAGFPGEDAEFGSLALTGGLMIVYIILLLCYRYGGRMKLKIPRTGRNVKITARHMILVFMLAELLCNTFFGVSENGTVSRTAYISDDAEMALIKDTYEAKDTFYRMELGEIRGRDDVIRYNLNGLSFFSSTCDDRMEKLMGSLGFYKAGNKYTYEGATPLTDAIFSIRYVVSGIEIEAPNVSLTGETENKYIYENEQWLPVGFIVNDEIEDWKYVEGDPFLTQNDFVRMATDTERALFTVIDAGEPETDGCEITMTEDDVWHYRAYEETGDLTWEIVPYQDCDIYMYFEAPYCESVRVTKADGESTVYGDEGGHIIHVGECAAGEKVTAEFPLDTDYGSGKVKFQVFAYHDDVFDEVYGQLSETGWDVSKYSSTTMYGTIEAESDGILMLSVPYDEGWTMTVDGEETDLTMLCGALTGCRISAGTHTLEMTYVPKGYRAGTALSAGSLAVLAAALAVRYGMSRRKRRALLRNN